MTGERRLRLFVAIEMPDAWKQALADVQERMKRSVQQDRRTAHLRPRWVRPEGVHVTLKFIGEVAPERLEGIKAQLGGALTEKPGVTLTLGSTGTFSGRRAPRVLLMHVDEMPSGALARLAATVEGALEPLGIAPERRPFQSHLTLARLPEQLSDQERRLCVEVATAVELPSVPSFAVEGISLMQSFIGPGGARYERLARWPA